MTFFKNLVKGFTLVELLVVMGILAVLAAGLIALINPADRVLQANDTKSLADINQVVGAINAYAASNNGNYPNAGSATGASFNIGTTALGTILTSELTTMPAGIASTSYAVNCVTAGPCKVAVQLRSSKYRAGAAYAGACWVSTNGSVQIFTGADLAANAGVRTNATCP